MQGTGDATTAGTAHVCEALFPRASRLLRSCTVTLLCRRGHVVDQASLLSALTCRTSATSDSCSRRCILLINRLVVVGHLSTNSTRSAEPPESSLPCSWQTLRRCTRAPDSQRPRGAPREHARREAPVKKGLVVILVDAPCRLISNFTSSNSRKLDPDCRRSL